MYRYIVQVEKSTITAKKKKKKLKTKMQEKIFRIQTNA